MELHDEEDPTDCATFIMFISKKHAIESINFNPLNVGLKNLKLPKTLKNTIKLRIYDCYWLF